MIDIIEQVKFNENGLVPAIVQDYNSGEILMFAWMNKTSLKLTIKTNYAVYYSRSRAKIWQKGEKSGHTQEVKEILCDCDCDVILLSVIQNGGISCHTGRKTCFFRKLINNNWQNIADVIKNPAEIYGKNK